MSWFWVRCECKNRAFVERVEKLEKSINKRDVELTANALIWKLDEYARSGASFPQSVIARIVEQINSLQLKGK